MLLEVIESETLRRSKAIATVAAFYVPFSLLTVCRKPCAARRRLRRHEIVRADVQAVHCREPCAARRRLRLANPRAGTLQWAGQKAHAVRRRMRSKTKANDGQHG